MKSRLPHQKAVCITFVTDDSGIGNDHLEPTVGEYEVELLNDLLVRLINAYGAQCGTQL